MKLTKPLCILDVETTGTDVALDRIVSLAIRKQHTNGTVEHFYQVFNPCIPIPAEVIEIHGITNDEAGRNAPFVDYANDILAMLSGSDIAGFNHINFDVPILWEEFHRCAIEWDLTVVNLIDAGNIFKKMEERTLSAAVKFYGCEPLDKAHNAMADVEATLNVLLAQAEKYEEIGKMSQEERAKFSAFDDRVDLAGKIVLNSDGVPVFNFGKSKGVPVLSDRGFAMWMLGKDFSENTKIAVRNILYPQKARHDDF
jgi:DNA polymerase III subunit epsilon